MLLYHFRDEKFGLISIKEKRLKISRINELNDPFELLGCMLADKDLRRSFNRMKTVFSQEIGIVCFSGNWRSPVQWSHYANNHKGICMGFEVPDDWPAKVNYIRRRLECPREFDQEFMLKVLTTKFSHWKYEKEFRGFIRLNPSEEDNGLFFNNFSERLLLRKVIVGCNSEINRKDVLKALGHLEKKVVVFKARPAFRTFNIVRNRNESMWA